MINCTQVCHYILEFSRWLLALDDTTGMCCEHCLWTQSTKGTRGMSVLAIGE